MIIKNENSIYVFFQMIEQLKPQSILDMGMFLKRVGSVSRKIMGCGVPERVQLDGVDFFPELSFPVYQTIYNEIIPAELYFEMDNRKNYDFVSLLGIEELQNRISSEKIISGAAVSRYVLADKSAQEWKMLEKPVRVTDMTVENDTYYLLEFGA